MNVPNENTADGVGGVGGLGKRNENVADAHTLTIEMEWKKSIRQKIADELKL